MERRGEERRGEERRGAGGGRGERTAVTRRGEDVRGEEEEMRRGCICKRWRTVIENAEKI